MIVKKEIEKKIEEYSHIVCDICKKEFNQDNGVYRDMAVTHIKYTGFQGRVDSPTFMESYDFCSAKCLLEGITYAEKRGEHINIQIPHHILREFVTFIKKQK